MKKSIKKFLIISQVLGWSALVASACTDNQTKITSQNSTESTSSSDSKNQTAPTAKHSEASNTQDVKKSNGTNVNPSTQNDGDKNPKPMAKNGEDSQAEMDNHEGAGVKKEATKEVVKESNAPRSENEPKREMDSAGSKSKTQIGGTDGQTGPMGGTEKETKVNEQGDGGHEHTGGGTGDSMPGSQGPTEPGKTVSQEPTVPPAAPESTPKAAA